MKAHSLSAAFTTNKVEESRGFMSIISMPESSSIVAGM